MKYYIVEIQKQLDGTFAHIVHTADKRNAAESAYYQVLAAAAVSNIPEHSAILFTQEGFPLMHQSYQHEVVTPMEEIETDEPVLM